MTTPRWRHDVSCRTGGGEMPVPIRTRVHAAGVQGLYISYYTAAGRVTHVRVRPATRYRARPRDVSLLHKTPQRALGSRFLSHLRSIGQSIPALARFSNRRRPKTLSSLLWSHFKAQPGFDEEQRQAMRDLRDGRAVPLREVSRDR